MAKKNGNKGSYTIMLEQAKQPPKLITNIKPLEKNMYNIAIIHPNTRKVLLEKNVECSDLNQAFDVANAMKEEVKTLPDYTAPWYEEVLHIPNPKRGVKKLKTKESVEDELNAQLDAIEDDEDAYNFDEEDLEDLDLDMDIEEEVVAKPKKTTKKVAKNIKKVKKEVKVSKKPKKATKVKKDKKINKKNIKKRK